MHNHGNDISHVLVVLVTLKLENDGHGQIANSDNLVSVKHKNG